MREKDRQVVNRLEALPLGFVREGGGDPQRWHAKGRLDHFFARHVGLAVLLREHEQLSKPEFTMGHPRIVYPDLITFRIDREIVRELDLRNHETILLRVLLADLAHSMSELATGAQKLDGQLASQREFDLRDFQRVLDGFLGLDLGPLTLLASLLLLLLRSPPSRERIAYECHEAAEQQEWRHRQPWQHCKNEHHQGRTGDGSRITAELPEHRLLGRSPRAALRDKQTGRQRHDQGRYLRDETVADG